MTISFCSSPLVFLFLIFNSLTIYFPLTLTLG